MKDLYIGSKFFGHDSSIFVVFPDSKEIFAIETERVTRYKHDFLYPVLAIEKMLNYKGIDARRVENVFFANSFFSQEKQSVMADEYDLQLSHRYHYSAKYKNDLFRKLKSNKKKNVLQKIINLITTKYGRYILRDIFFTKFGYKKNENVNSATDRYLKKIFPNAKIHISYYDHQLCHALAAYYSSRFNDSLLVTSDGWGDDNFSSVYLVKNNKIDFFTSSSGGGILLETEKGECVLGASVGGVYGYFTELYGFSAGSDEGKIEALAAYGDGDNEIYYSLMEFSKINKQKKSIEIDANRMGKYLKYEDIQKVVAKYKREDVAAAVQRYLEDIHVEYLKFITSETGIDNICFSGGVAANVILNLNIYEKITKNLHIAPAMSDDGTAQGAAIQLLLDKGYSVQDLKWLADKKMPYYSTSYTREEVLNCLKNFEKEIYYEDIGDDWPEYIAQFVVDGKIGAIFHGRMEWGPRALGNRSIIADARRGDFRRKINLHIKNRPEFQPFCPSMLLEEKDRLFTDAYANKHMTCAFRMKKKYISKLPGAVHVDGTSRVQFVEMEDNPNYYRMLKRIKKLTGFGVVINTSFNKHGRTIVETPEDAIVDFLDTNMDFLLIEGFLVTRKKV